MTNKEIEDICNLYCGNNSKKLNKIVDKLMSSYPEKEYLEDFYGEARYYVWECARRFDTSLNVPFDAWLRQCLAKKLATYHRDMTKRDKRKANACLKSLDAPVQTDEGEMCLYDFITGDKDVKLEETLSKKRWGDYFNRLTKKQKKIISLRFYGYSMDDICKELNISRSKLNKHLEVISCPEKTRYIHDVRLKNGCL